MGRGGRRRQGPFGVPLEGRASEIRRRAVGLRTHGVRRREGRSGSVSAQLIPRSSCNGCTVKRRADLPLQWMGRDVLRHVRRCLSVIVPALVVAGALTLGSSAVARAEAPESHPRLLFSGADVPALRRRVAEGGVLGAAWQRLRAKAEGVLVRVRPELVATGAYKLQNELNTYLIELGLAYQLSGDARYGRRVVDLLAALGDAGYPFWSGQDLGLGDLLEGVGLGFDWSYELMTPAERTKIVGDLTAHEMLLFDRTLLHPTNAASTYPVSNWMGVTAGGAGLALLAIEGEPGAPTGLARYLDVALEKVSTYLSVGFDAEGAGHEGLLYATYGTKNAVPFALAARRAGHGDLLATTGLRSMARLGCPRAAARPGAELRAAQRLAATAVRSGLRGDAVRDRSGQWRRAVAVEQDGWPAGIGLLRIAGGGAGGHVRRVLPARQRMDAAVLPAARRNAGGRSGAARAALGPSPLARPGRCPHRFCERGERRRIDLRGPPRRHRPLPVRPRRIHPLRGRRPVGDRPGLLVRRLRGHQRGRVRLGAQRDPRRRLAVHAGHEQPVLHGADDRRLRQRADPLAGARRPALRLRRRRAITPVETISSRASPAGRSCWRSPISCSAMRRGRTRTPGR